MYPDTLNIDFHRRAMIIKALNRYDNMRLSALALGIHERSLYRWREVYNIIKDEKGVWCFVEPVNKQEVSYV